MLLRIKSTYIFQFKKYIRKHWNKSLKVDYRTDKEFFCKEYSLSATQSNKYN